MLCLVTESCPTLCHPVDCSPPGSSVLGDSPGNNTGVGCHALLQGIFPTQGSNSGLLHCSWIFYHLGHQVSPWILEWVAYPFSSGSSQPRNQTGSPALQADSLPAELPGKATQQDIPKFIREEYKLIFTCISSLISHHFPVWVLCFHFTEVLSFPEYMCNFHVPVLLELSFLLKCDSLYFCLMYIHLEISAQASWFVKPTLP